MEPGKRYRVKIQQYDDLGRKSGVSTFTATYMGTNYAGHHLFDPRPIAGTVTIPADMLLWARLKDDSVPPQD